MIRKFLCGVAYAAAFLGGPANSATVDVAVPTPISRVVIELGTSEVFPSGIGNWGLDNLITVAGNDLQFLTFEEIPPQSFGPISGVPGIPESLTVGTTTFRASRLDPAIPFILPVYGFNPGEAFDTIYTDGSLLLADANTRIFLDFETPVNILQFGLSFASGSELREGNVGTVELFGLGLDNSLGEFDLRADLVPGDGLTSARFTAVVPIPATGLLLLSALGLSFLLRVRSRSV